MKDYSRYHKLFNLIPVGIAIVEPNTGTWTDVNNHCCNMFGWSREEMEKFTWIELTHTDDIPFNLDQFDRLLRGEIKGYEIEKRYKRKDGSFFWANVSAKCLRNPDGSPRYIIGTIEDITKRKLAEESFRASEERYRLLFEQSNDAIVIFQNAYVTDANQKACAMTGYSKDRLIGMHVLDLHTETEHPRLVEQKRRLGAPMDIIFESQWKRSDGKIIDVELSNVFYDMEKHLSHCIARDITERKRSEKILERNERRFRAMIEKSSEVILLMNGDGQKLYVSPTITDILGYSQEEYLALDWGALIHPDDHPTARSKIMDLRTDPERVMADIFRVRHKNGDWRWIKHNARNLLDDPAVNAFVVNFHDTTELMSARNTILKEKAMLEQLFDNPHVAISLTDRNDHYIRINKTYTRIFGYTTEELVGKHAPSVKLPREIDKDLDTIRIKNNAKKGELLEFEARFINKQGIPVDVIAYLSPVLINNELVGLYALYHDITDMKEAVRRQNELIEELEARNAELERFTYTVSHDLKSPLITIKAFLGFIEKDAQSGDMTRMKGDIKRIAAAVKRMEQHLNDLLELSRIGRVVNPPEWIPFQEVVKAALSNVSGRIKQEKARIIIQDKMPLVFADEVRLREVLENLIDNAVKFIPDRKKPTIEIGYIQDKDRAVFFVKDNGIGIKPEYKARVFRLFERLDHTIEGTGIGLALVKRIIEVHGGDIWIESRGLGHGATVCFTLPHRKESADIPLNS